MQDNPITDPAAKEDADDELPNYQDDLDTNDNVIDPIMIEHQGVDDDPVQILGVPERELKAELDKRAFGDIAKPLGNGEAHSDADEGMYEGTEDDLRESIEDMDEDDKKNLPGND